MSRARFIAAARLEFLAEVIYYSEAQAGLGTRFAVAGIVIFADAHHAKRPYYWQSRVRGR